MTRKERRAKAALAAIAATSAFLIPASEADAAKAKPAAEKTRTKHHRLVGKLWDSEVVKKARVGAKAKPRKKGSHAAAKKKAPKAGALAATITVNSLADNTTAGDSLCTLREALNNANNDNDGTSGDCVAGSDAADVINITPTGTINATSRFNILDGVTINGPGMAALTVDAANNDRVFYLYAPSESVTISNLTASHGDSSDSPGGGIVSFNTNVTLDHVTVSSSDAGSSLGGGFFAAGTEVQVTIQSSTLSGNAATVGGGAYIALYDGSASVVDSTFTNNTASYGGGLGLYGYMIANLNGATITENQAISGGGLITHLYQVTIADTTISGNTALGVVGGALLDNLSGASIQESRITGNEAAAKVGGLIVRHIPYISSAGKSAKAGKQAKHKLKTRANGVVPFTFSNANLKDTTISGNTAADSAGLLLYGGSTGTNGVQTSTISGNTAVNFGGGIYLYNGTARIEDSTIANNQATDAASAGGGIFSYYDDIQIFHSTIAGNQAGDAGGNIFLVNNIVGGTMRNSIVANGIADTDPDVSGSGVLTASYSLIETPSPTVVTDGTDITNGSDPQLGPLQNNGGPTETMLIPLNSIVVNAGDPAYAPPPATDQRGKPRVSGGRTDMGAVELDAGTLQFTQANYPVSESVGNATIGISRTGGSDPIAFNFQTTDLTATSSADYTSTTGLISFAMNETGTKNGNIPIIDDAVVESSEQFFVSLAGVPAGFLGIPFNATVTIADNDVAAAVTFSINSVSLTEGDSGTKAFNFTVTKTGTTAATTTVQVSTSDGTATAPSDYTALPLQTLTFLPGDTTKQVTVNVNGDTLFEPNETFTVNLSNPSGGTIAIGTGTGTIQNDDLNNADLAITKTPNQPTVAPGGTLAWTISVTNNGPQAATGVTVTDTIPAGTTFSSAVPSQGSCSGTTTVTCNLGGLANGASATIVLTVTNNSSSGTKVNTAAVTGSPTDPNASNNASTATAVTVTNASVPTLDEYGLMALAALLALAAMVKLRD
ncbi:MAG: IPTL-CTERM sorting domain-containing protein [Acidobacteria bacterium]|nr:IPTL-CTERM sorting domain-containing protein [Acidobacteriota bacterium]